MELKIWLQNKCCVWWVRAWPGLFQPILKYLGSSFAPFLLPTQLFSNALGRQQMMAQIQRPCHPDMSDLEDSILLLASAWYGHAVVGTWGMNQQMKDFILSPSPSFFPYHSDFHVNKKPINIYKNIFIVFSRKGRRW